MALQRLTFNTKEEWLEARTHGLGASESASAVGMSIYVSKEALMDIKLGITPQPDISGNASVQRGILLEPILRNLFLATHEDLSIDYHPYDMLYQSEYPWRYATLDGEIKKGDERGILEIKTAEPKGKTAWESWNNQIPNYYYTQVLHQLLATGYDFVILYACLFEYTGDISIREYEIRREDCGEDLKWLQDKEDDFWKEVEEKKNGN